MKDDKKIIIDIQSRRLNVAGNMLSKRMGGLLGSRTFK